MDQKKVNTILYISLVVSLIIIIILLFVLYLKESEDKPKNTQDIEIKDANSNQENLQEDLNSSDVKNEEADEVLLDKGNNVEKDFNTTTTEKHENYTSNDKLVIDEFTNLETSTVKALNNENSESALKKAKGVFISVVDFLFYDGEIKGITFDDLSEAGKEKVLSIASSIDTKIETKFPGYKETISSKASNAFVKASELIKKGANNVKEFSREKLGEENYNSIIAAKDELVTYTKFAFSIIKDVGGNFLESASDKIKNWYENFKNNN